MTDNLTIRHTLLAITCALGMATTAAAQNISSPSTDSSITPPAGNSAFLLGRAVGTQGYVCLPRGTGASWTVNGARPEATLFASFFGLRRADHHALPQPQYEPQRGRPKPVAFGNATWQSSFDSSKVWAQPVHSIPAGSDASCPNAGAIGCLLLQSIVANRDAAG